MRIIKISLEVVPFDHVRPFVENYAAKGHHHLHAH